MVLGREVLAPGDATQRRAEIPSESLAVLHLLEPIGVAPDDTCGDGKPGEPVGDGHRVVDVECPDLSNHGAGAAVVEVQTGMDVERLSGDVAVVVTSGHQLGQHQPEQCIRVWRAMGATARIAFTAGMGHES